MVVLCLSYLVSPIITLPLQMLLNGQTLGNVNCEFAGGLMSFVLFNRCRLTFNNTVDRSSRWQMYFKIGVLKNFAIFTGKHLCWSIFLIKLLAWNSATLFKRDSNTVFFLWILRNFYKQHFFMEHLRWLLLRGEIGAFYNRFSKYTFIWYSYKFNNISVSFLFRILLCLAFYIVIFITLAPY